MCDRDIDLFIKDFMKEIRKENAAIFAGAGLSASAGFVNGLRAQQLAQTYLAKMELSNQFSAGFQDCMKALRSHLESAVFVTKDVRFLVAPEEFKSSPIEWLME